MSTTIRIDDDVLNELKARAKAADQIFGTPNSILREILGLNQRSPQAQSIALSDEITATKPAVCVLVLHAPYYEQGGKGSREESHMIETYYKTGKPLGYALTPSESKALKRGDKVVLLRNDYRKTRIEATLVELLPSGRTTYSGIPRYDVIITNQKIVDYSYNVPTEKVNRRGIKVVEIINEGGQS